MSTASASDGATVAAPAAQAAVPAPAARPGRRAATRPDQPGGLAVLARIIRLARPLRGQLVLAVGAGALATSCGIALLAVSGFILARASQHPGIIAISVAVVAVRGLSVGRALLRYTERLAGHDAAFRVLADLRVAVYRRLERLAPAGLAAFRSGDLLARLVSDVDAIQDVFVRGLAPAATAAIAGAAAVTGCLFLLAPAAAVLAAGLVVAGGAVSWLTAAVARRASLRTAPARGQLAAAVSEFITGAAELDACGATDRELARCAAADAELTRLARRSGTAAGLGAGLATAITGLTVWGVLVLGVAAVSGGTLTRVPLAVLTLTALAAFEAVTPLPAAAIALGDSVSSARRIAAILAAPEPVADPPVPLRLPGPAPGRAVSGGSVRAGSACGDPVHVRLRGACVRYRADGPAALAGLDLDLAPGRRVAIVGPSGAGKSTAAAVLLRFCELSAGSATLNGQDLATYAADDVRTLIGGCAQDPHIFAASLTANLRVARPEATDAELADAARQARLLDWIDSLPQGWDTQAGLRGSALSGGQRQRLALARALLADPAVLVLDEPVAHLDSGTRRAVTADLLSATRGRTTLLITHDLAGLEQVDEIVVLDRGAVTERGPQADLLAAGGWYAERWREQQQAQSDAGLRG
jgi:ATP-binding cassette subfamily C protein CydC